jgi:hypothetical protein
MVYQKKKFPSLKDIFQIFGHKTRIKEKTVQIVEKCLS